MDRVVKKCDKCGGIFPCDPRATIHREDDCNGNFIETSLSYDDLITISRISNDNDFFQAMIDLKEKDIIEYNLKMSQFRSQVAQQKSSSVRNDNRPKCPICNSTNLSKISTAKKATKVGLFGIFGAGDIGKTWKCNNCGSKF